MRSLWKIPDLVEALGERGFHAALLADFETLTATEEFDRRMREAGHFPLVGVTRHWPSMEGRLHEVRLVAETSTAWPSLVRFAQWNGEPSPGLTLIVGASPDPWWRGDDRILNQSVVVELYPDQENFLTELPMGWAWVPASRVRFKDPGDISSHKLLAAIGGVTPDPTARPLPPSSERWLNPYRQWPQDRLWQPHDEGSIFTRRVFTIPSLPGVDDEDENLQERARQGLLKRYDGNPTDDAWRRLAYELSVIQELGFSGYFLVVQDLVAWAKSQEIRVGPGRGSAAGSLVSYALDITDVNPLQYGLIFERFLNPDRRTLPDIDLDFEDSRRGEVITYLRQRHGSEYVAQIGTFGTLGARAALRDVARVMGLNPALVSQVLKSAHWGVGDSLSDHQEVLHRASAKAELGTQWIERAQSLEGLPRHRSIHAAGVVISPVPLQNALLCHRERDGAWITDFEMASLESLGYVKLDVLGLRTLTTVARIEQDLGLSSDAFGKVDGQDGKTLRLLARGDTEGIFQLDGRGVKSLLQQLAPQSVEEVMLIVALYRPGPMDAIQELLRRRKADYRPAPDDPLESGLEETYGIMVYQEQLMAAVTRVAGFTLAEADEIRRAISKKDHALLAQKGSRLVQAMKSRGYPASACELFWSRIRAFGDYGFNKSHAASYGLLAYYLAYFKAHFPLNFWAAELSSHDQGERQKELMIQAISQGILVQPPHVNDSLVHFSVRDDAIWAGLSSIRGVGLEMASRIVHERLQSGPYQSIDAFHRRVNLSASARLIEALAEAGALKGFGGSVGSAQMQWFEDKAAVPLVGTMDRVDWPQAQGPVYVRIEPGADPSKISVAIRSLASQFSGDVPVLLIEGRDRVRAIPDLHLRPHWSAIDAIKEVPGVKAAGRRVTFQ